MIALTVNGKRVELDGPTSLLSYMESQGIKLRFTAVAYNGTVLRRSELPGVTLSDGDHVEIVRAVGGG